MQLLQLFNELQSKEISSSSLKVRELIQHASKIALQFLNHKYNSERTKFANLGYTFSDISIDAIAPLFVNHKKECILGIINSFNDWKTPIKTEEQAQYFLYKIVTNRVEQELIHIYKETDPFFSKIHDAIEFIIEKNGYLKKTILGTVYILENCESFSLKTISPADFENLNFSLFRGKLENIIRNLFRELIEEMGYTTAIPMNLFVKRIKHFHLSDDNLNLAIFKENHDERIDTGKIVEDSLSITISKLNLSYKNKLNTDEITAFKSALIQIGSDLANGGLSGGLFEYLNNQMLDLSSDKFYRDYHSLFDYLVRILKKEIASRIEFSNTH